MWWLMVHYYSVIPDPDQYVQTLVLYGMFSNIHFTSFIGTLTQPFETGVPNVLTPHSSAPLGMELRLYDFFGLTSGCSSSQFASTIFVILYSVEWI